MVGHFRDFLQSISGYTEQLIGYNDCQRSLDGIRVSIPWLIYGKHFHVVPKFNRLSQQVGQPAIQIINSVVVAASDLRYLGEDVSDQRIKFQILGNLLPELEALRDMARSYNAVRMPDVQRGREGDP